MDKQTVDREEHLKTISDPELRERLGQPGQQTPLYEPGVGERFYPRQLRFCAIILSIPATGHAGGRER